MEFKHKSVLLKESIEGLNIKPDGIYVDCTLGGGGHSSEIIKKLNEKGSLIGIDQDIDAINAAKKKLGSLNFKNIYYVNENYRYISQIINRLGIESVDGIIMDLGVSSYQLDEKNRGFSYMQDAPLDMRMDKEGALTAFDVVNKYSENELFRVIKEYGEEKFARRISRNIVSSREIKPIDTTFELVDIIKRSIPAKFRREGPHPAKRTFQAIRIEVNNELNVLDDTLKDAVNVLKKGGRISVITFQSLEDRIVKRNFKKLENPCTCPKDFPVCVCGKKPVVKIINKKPIGPSLEELEGNPRSRSAKLRIAEKL